MDQSKGRGGAEAIGAGRNNEIEVVLFRVGSDGGGGRAGERDAVAMAEMVGFGEEGVEVLAARRGELIGVGHGGWSNVSAIAQRRGWHGSRSQRNWWQTGL